MIRRMIILVSLGAAGWFLYTRLLRPKPAYVDDWDDFAADDEEPAGVADRVADTVAGAPSAADASVNRIRALVGDHDEAPVAVADPARAIKGNVNREGEKIYHVPGDPNYERTRAEQTFATAEEAEAAGFRRAGNRPRED
ncbi:MAG: hypothetical protein ACRDJE_21315 [Dehalococcoidia bacterium]